MLSAAGHSYAEIARDLDLSHTQVNRRITEGRARARAALG